MRWLKPKSDSLEEFVRFLLGSLAKLGVVVAIWITAVGGHPLPWPW